LPWPLELPPSLAGAAVGPESSTTLVETLTGVPGREDSLALFLLSGIAFRVSPELVSIVPPS